MYVPRGSNVVPFWLWPIFFLGIIINYPKRNYIRASGYVHMYVYISMYIETWNRFLTMYTNIYRYVYTYIYIYIYMYIHTCMYNAVTLDSKSLDE